MSVTFHKAFDAARDPFEALDDLIALGVDRVLTSGQAPTAMEGLAMLAELTRRAAGRIAVMAGGSIPLEQIRPIDRGGPPGDPRRFGRLPRRGDRRRRWSGGSWRPRRWPRSIHITTRADWERALAEGVVSGRLAGDRGVHPRLDRRAGRRLGQPILPGPVGPGRAPDRPRPGPARRSTGSLAAFGRAVPAHPRPAQPRRGDRGRPARAGRVRGIRLAAGRSLDNFSTLRDWPGDCFDILPSR